MSLRGRARHEEPALDEAALACARAVDELLVAATEMGVARWAAFLAPYPELLRDAAPGDLRAIARRVRAAYGPKDSIAEALPWQACIELRDALDVLLRALVRAEARR